MLKAIKWEDVESSNVNAVYWDSRTQTVCVRFNNGGLYSYIGANYEIFMDLRHAPSVGQYLHQVLKAYPYTRWDTESQLLDHLNV